jgi:multidrug efflux pump subunit AcrA (membrane-fusion protein)
MMRGIRIMISTAAILTIGCGGEESIHVNDQVQLEPLEVGIEHVAPREVATLHESIGTVRSEISSMLSSRIMGYVIAVDVEEGDRVRRGQLLARIDSRETRAQLERAEAGVNEVESGREEIERAIRAAESGLDAARANAKLAESTYTRFKELLDRKSVSQQEFDEADAKYLAATAEVRRVEEILQSVRAKKAQVDARISQAKANLDSARLFHSYTDIKSPLNGVVTAKKVEIGQLASPGTPLFTVEDGSNYRLDATVEESRIRFLRTSQEVTIRVDALDEDLPGRVSEVVPVADPASRSFTVKIDLPSHPQLRSGLFGRAFFPGITRESLTIPISSVVSRGQLSGVFVVDSEKRARFQLIKTGEESGDRVEVLSGLEVGDQVVTSPVQQVREGQPLVNAGGRI